MRYSAAILWSLFCLAFCGEARGQEWLVRPVTAKAGVSREGKDLVLSNGLLERRFRLSPDMACISYSSLVGSRQHLRAVGEEARLTINGKEYKVGGLLGQRDRAYLLREWVDGLSVDPSAFGYVNYTVGPIVPQINWKSRFWSSRVPAASGKTVSFLFRPRAAELSGLEVRVNYELYDGIPLIVKYLTITNNSSREFILDRVVNEVLNLVEEESSVVGSVEKLRKPAGIYFETDYAFNNSSNYTNSDQTSHWKADYGYDSQVNYTGKTPCVLEVYPEQVSGISLGAGKTFTSLRTHELMIDSYEREWRSLAIRRMYKVVAPWSLSNPIFMHLISKDDAQVRTAIDQCAATGYEAVIMSFGSHLDMEDTSSVSLSRWKALADYAHGKGVKLGCYSLFSSRSISPQDDVIDPMTGLPSSRTLYTHAPCFGSRWGLNYCRVIKNFFAVTGFDIFENDGPYAGDSCGSVVHPGHKGLGDSQWEQMQIQKGLYRDLNEKGVYINAPDWYVLSGSNKIGLGYREENFSRPRAQQVVLNRQSIYDGTWEKNPSMGWGFVPLTEYLGGGAEATLEPLSEHLKEYRQLMVQYYGAGVQACYRGPRLYDTEKTREMVTEVISWYKRYREILNSDIIHLRRPDGRDWDGIMHVNPGLKQKAVLLLYNPTLEPIARRISVPMQYGGLSGRVMVREKEGKPLLKEIKNNQLEISFSLPAGGYTYIVIE